MPTSDFEFVGKILDATRKGKVDWEKTATDDQYAASFSGRWTVLIDKMRGGTYVLVMEDAEGNEMLRIGSDSDSRLEDLFELARRHALNVNQAIEDVMKELN
jgi:hypothetical protein